MWYVYELILVNIKCAINTYELNYKYSVRNGNGKKNLIWKITKMRIINRDIYRERVALVYPGSKEKLGFKEKED